MNHGSFFTGIGGFDLAAEWVGWNNIFQVENNKHRIKDLNRLFPNVKKYANIEDFEGSEYESTIDVISGGFPCQPFSIAGKQRGKNDDRWLWPEMRRAYKGIKPPWIVAENVPGIIGMELDTVLSNLEADGYEATTFNIPAIALNAWHIRKRVWIIAYSNENDSRRKRRIVQSQAKEVEGTTQRQNGQRMRYGTSNLGTDISNSSSNGIEKGKQNGITKFINQDGFQGGIVSNSDNRRCKEPEIISNLESGRLWRKPVRKYWEVEPPVGRVADGLPGRVAQLEGLGNAIVPQIAYEFFNLIDYVSSTPEII